MALALPITAVIRGDQRTGTEDITFLDLLVPRVSVPAEQDAALQQPEHAIAGFSGLEDQVAWSVVTHFTLGGKSTQGVEGIHGSGQG